ncbi:ribonuclease E inhibitor RraB [Parasphingorhabdus cellanae]|uniref:Ribonuclease E inhibitor RraB n=1 Tax=Parasphingorhabdus cellanae TaxID=2806553 RepID=A0ABX7T3M2_9SPHN|nr:ribonuclease E inhibitor RraB [Parasphingorhabdus cellanae]QTD56169.1 ribonuclease E inhibitor RraB [Parasphingorhabdus cellanae]
MSAIDPAHLAEEWATDDEILKNMAAGGDLDHVVREINVQFVGAVANLNKLKNDAKKLGFKSAYVEKDEGEWQIELQIDADTLQQTIRELTRKCLEIEQDYDIDHDGWGCFSCNENGPISDENPA